ncbi:Nitrogen assimilation transcription factor nit-4-like protein [Elsinoe fawcettii]|nr:Nitrogen assimilation transcription factor nit-4-like protein [Elsinoe fawcettii]
MSTKNTSHRALLPAPTNQYDGEQSRDHTAFSQKTQSKPKRAQISVACEVCRRRKAKCDGQRPDCSPCRARGLDCRYSADENATRMMTLKRKYQAASEKNDELEDILTFMRDGPLSQASIMLDRLRAGVDISQLTQLARSADISPAYSGLPTPTSPIMSLDDLRSLHQHAYHDFDRRSSSNSIRERMCVNALLVGPSLESDMPVSPTLINSSEFHDSLFHLERIRSHDQEWANYIDPALLSADITHWTSIHSDNDLLVHLLSMYLAWEAPAILWLDRQAFFMDLISHGTMHCSSMLINAILCVGSHISPRLDRSTQSNEPNSLASRFREEASRQLQSGKAPLDVTTVQATILLISMLNIDGHSIEALALTDKVQDMCAELSLLDMKHDPQVLTSVNISIEERVKMVAPWTVHNYLTFQRYAARMISTFPPTPASPPPLEANLIPLQDNNVPSYFRSAAALEAHGIAAFQAYSKLQVIQARLATAKFSRDRRFGIQSASILYNELVQWTDGLPAVMLPSFPSPHALAFHMICHSMILDIFYPFRTSEELVPVRAPKDGKQGLVTVEDIVTLSRRQIQKSIQIYRVNFGFTRGPICILQVMFISCVDLIRDIEDDDAVDMISNVMRAMKELSLSFWVERKLMMNVAKLLEQHKDKLPDDVRKCLWDWEQDISSVMGDDDNNNNDLWDLERRMAAMQGMMDIMAFEDE